MYSIISSSLHINSFKLISEFSLWQKPLPLVAFRFSSDSGHAQRICASLSRCTLRAPRLSINLSTNLTKADYALLPIFYNQAYCVFASKSRFICFTNHFFYDIVEQDESCPIKFDIFPPYYEFSQKTLMKAVRDCERAYKC